jgi:hypothetical protein
MYTAFAVLLNAAQEKAEIRVALVSTAGTTTRWEMIFKTFWTILPAVATARKRS